jgi:hypothetical protein
MVQHVVRVTVTVKAGILRRQVVVKSNRSAHLLEVQRTVLGVTTDAAEMRVAAVAMRAARQGLVGAGVGKMGLDRVLREARAGVKQSERRERTVVHLTLPGIRV